MNEVGTIDIDPLLGPDDDPTRVENAIYDESS
jgi:hypothetical protein